MKVRVLVDSQIESNSGWVEKTMEAFKSNHWLGYYRYDDKDDTHFISPNDTNQQDFYLNPNLFTFIEDAPVVGRAVLITSGLFENKTGEIAEIIYNNRIFGIRVLDTHIQVSLNLGDFEVIE